MLFFEKVRQRIKVWLLKIKESFIDSFPSEYLSFGKNKKFAFVACYITMLLAVFGTVLFQAPNFIDWSLNTYFIFIWIALAVLLFIFDYKKFIFSFFRSFVFLIPFLLYLSIAVAFGINAYSSELTRYILLSFFILILGSSFAPYINSRNRRWIFGSFSLAAFFLALLTYILVLRGTDLSSPTYAYESKNSTGPILLCASVFLFFSSTSSKFLHRILRWLGALFFIVMIAIMKCRAVLVAAPFVYLVVFLYTKPTNVQITIVFSIVMLAIILIFSIPSIRETIIDNILFNNKTNLDSLSSGRISSIIKAFEMFRPFLGSGDTYVDCFPVQLICSFGIFGSIMLLPFIGLRFYALYLAKKRENNRANFYLLLILTIFFMMNSLLEGHGAFGPGARSFVYWLVIGFHIGRTRLMPLTNQCEKLCVKTTPDIVFTALSALLVVLTSAISVIPNAFSSLSLKVYDRIDRSVVSGEFVAPTSISVEGPNKLCIGQTIKLNAVIYPENVSDCGHQWESWSAGNVLTINKDTGEITGIGTGSVTVNVISLSDRKIQSSRVVSVVRPDDFIFPEYTISVEKNLMMIGDKMEIVYDRNTISNPEWLLFSSSDKSVASVDEHGVITAAGSGDCFISSQLKIGNKIKSNDILISVSDETITPVTSIAFDVPNEIYQYEPLSLETRLNEGASNTGVKYSISGVPYSFENGKLILKKGGEATVTASSISNPEVVLTKSIKVLKNEPVKIILEPIDWLYINNKYKLNIDVQYESGIVRRATKDEVVTESARVSFGKNGICDDGFTLCAMSSGYAQFTFRSKETIGLAKRFSFSVKKVPFEQNVISAESFGLFVFSTIFSIFAFVSLMIKGKKRHVFLVLLFAFSLGAQLLLVFLQIKTWNPLYLISLMMPLIPCIIITVAFRKKKWSLGYDSRLPDFEEFERKELEKKDFYFEVTI